MRLLCDRCGTLIEEVGIPRWVADILASPLEHVLVLCPPCKQRLVGELSDE